MKPFLALSEVQPDQILMVENNNRQCYEIYYNGYTLLVDQTVFPVGNPGMINVFYLALYRITLFLNTLPVQGMNVLKLTGFTDFCNFKIEPLSPLYVNGRQFLFIYKEKNSIPSFITK